MPLNNDEIATVKGMLARGDRQHDIAAHFGINSARVAEVKWGQTGDTDAPSPLEDLPPAGPYMAGR
jgi:hypothetical protein